jgi:hypothetical protein
VPVQYLANGDEAIFAGGYAVVTALAQVCVDIDSVHHLLRSVENLYAR